MKRSKNPKIEITGRMRVRACDVFHRAVEEGISAGWRRAHKHTDSPGLDTIKEQILTEVINAVSEYFAFDQPLDGS
jgi:hypothetical protein